MKYWDWEQDVDWDRDVTGSKPFLLIIEFYMFQCEYKEYCNPIDLEPEL